MYDISFIMPICDSNKHYFNRFIDVKKYCFLNIGDRQIRVKLLRGPGEDFYGHEITSGWPTNVTAEIVETPYLEAPQKIVHYYTQLTDEEITSAKWHAKIDDDTANDIEKTMWHLEDEFDYNDKNYLTTALKTELEEVERRILRMMGYEHWVDNEIIKHEWEGCFVSAPMMMAIKNSEKAQNYLKAREVVKGGYGDQPVAIACKLCKIGAIRANFASQFSELNKFSIFGGYFSHIHFFSGRSQGNSDCYEFYKSLINTELHKDLKDKIRGSNQIFNNELLSFKKNNELIVWGDKKEEEEEQIKKKGLWSIYKTGILAVCFNGEYHEHSVIRELPNNLITEQKTRILI